MRYLIVNGDDLGMSPGVTRGILEAHRHGILTSASLMVDRPGAAAAAAEVREAAELSVGLHLELAEPAEREPSPTVERQLRRFEQLMGQPPTHIDSHRDGHRESRVLSTVLRLAARLGVPARGYSPVTSVSKFYGHWAGEDHPEHVSVDNLLNVLDSELQEGVTELICHPGYVDPELDSTYRTIREAELATLCDPRLPEALARRAIGLVGFRDLPALLPQIVEKDRDNPWPQ